MPDVKETAAHWLAHAEEEARRAQKALDEFDSLNLSGQSGSREMDIARQRSELVAARDEYLRDAAYWRDQLTTGGASTAPPSVTKTPSR